jgi:alpha-L-rhamnosidase
MYVGDTRLEVLTTYAWTPDDRLPRKAISLFDASRKQPGFTQSRYPTRVQQTISPFSAWWVGMVYDFSMWRDDAAFVRDMLPGVRAVLDTFQRFKTAEGLIHGPPGWNFMDWVPAWRFGMPPDGMNGVSAPLNLQLAWIYKQAAQLEESFGSTEVASLQRRRGTELSTAATTAFWDDARGMFADDLAHKHYSEHAQSLALLGDLVEGERAARVERALLSAEDLARTTIYFTHYLFETYAKIGRIDRLFDRLPLWFDHKANGLRTTIEMPEPSRSDCHAWGAHPIYHYFASVLGFRPAAPGFARVTVFPQLGPLKWARGAMPHPRGEIRLDLKQTEPGRFTGTIELPVGVSGELRAGNAIALKPGINQF